MSIILTLILLGIIILIHELGHFLTAKFFRMPVFEFAIGMGPKVFSRKKGETVYSIRALPLGGFVNIGGMQPEELDFENLKKEKIDEIAKKLKDEEEFKNVEFDDEKFVDEVEKRLNLVLKEEKERQSYISKNGFYKKSPFARFIVLIAGVVMNFVSAIIAIFIMLSITNMKPMVLTKAVVGVVRNDSKVSGKLKINDKILEINGKKIQNWKEMTDEISKISKNYKNEDISLKILRNNREITQNVKLTYYNEAKSNLLGIQVLQKKLTLGEKFHSTFYTFKEYFKMTLVGVKMLVTGKVALKDMTGPVGLPKIVNLAYSSGGLLALLGIFILISINIGIMNLLPIPALDGGRILFVLPEFIGIKINKKIEEKIHIIGMIFLMILMLIIVFFDITKYF
ncbi:M50 family metallopeptidase [Leptotrichia sp. oral taxon 847]|uniref:M50 family metallopeptidase n=1 Tax=Leptotrichia sp. oral taxon 847 TaxID=1785996 RepID=UPI000767F335|nr:M50 family metallopeptidase [Leptotrichia sp. oral taxon 847]AMD95347.1 peptidase M50 [Leptotrichia sp. oral taxon 847]